MTLSQMSRGAISARLALVLILGVAAQPQTAHALAQPPIPDDPNPRAKLFIEADLDAGLHLLYELKFEEARAQIVAWERTHSNEPVGPALEAAADLFEQFYRQGVLTSDFFLNDQ